MSSELIPQSIVIFVGTPGSGKSTLATQWCDTFKNWIRINQDDLGTRVKCERKTHSALKQGKSVIIDRCNFDKNQRKVWIEIAKKFNISVDCLEFRVPFQVLQQRIMDRKDHPSGVQGKRGVEILTEFANTIQPCHIREGVDRVIVFPSIFRGPIFDIKTWEWLSAAFSVPLKFLELNQKSFVSDTSQTTTSNSNLVPPSINNKKVPPKSSTSSSSGQSKTSRNFQNRFDILLDIKSTTSEINADTPDSTD